MRLLALLLAFVLSSSAFAQFSPPALDAAPQASDAYGRTTPRGTVQGYLAAVADDDLSRAALYLDAPEATPFEIRRLARSLQTVLDRSGTLLATPEIANTPEGRAGDNLPADMDRIGGIGPDQAVDLLLRRKENADGSTDGPVWLFASETLAHVPDLVRRSRAALIERFTPEPLQGIVWNGAKVGDWIATALLAIASLVAGWFVAWLLAFALRSLYSRRGLGRVGRWAVTARRPLGLMLATFWFKGGSLALGIAVVAREFTGRFADIVTVVAFAWLVVTVVEHVARALLVRSERGAHASAVSVLKLVKRVATTLVVLFAAVIVLDILGVDVTTGLAALGIGGLALALGAQKTIENLVGSVTLVADQPIRVGDFCQFADVLGTVEDIGMRSTRVRTLERTVVTIPNGAFSSMQIENYTRRERFLFKHTFGLRYETSAAETRRAIAVVRSLLHRHETVMSDTVRVRLLALGSDSLSVEAFAYVGARDWNAYLAAQEEILLAVMEAFEGIGVDFAFPSQTVYLRRDERRAPPAGIRLAA